MPELWTWIARGPTRPAFGSLKSSTSVALQVVAPGASGQQAIRATPVDWSAMISHWAHAEIGILVWESCLNSLPPPLLCPGR